MEGSATNNICGFSADPGKLDQVFDTGWHNALVVLDQGFAAVFQIFGFIPVEACRMN